MGDPFFGAGFLDRALDLVSEPARECSPVAFGVVRVVLVFLLGGVSPRVWTPVLRSSFLFGAIVRVKEPMTPLKRRGEIMQPFDVRVSR